MRYFRKIAEGFDVAPALAELERVGGWEAPDPNAQIDYNRSRGLKPVSPEPPGMLLLPSWRSDNFVTEGTGSYFPEHPEVQALMERAAALADPAGRITNAKVRAMPPQSRMGRHRDGLPSQGRRRFHLPLQCDGLAFVEVAGERCRFKPGELWEVMIEDRPHFAANCSYRPRLHLFFDIMDESLLLATATVLEAERL